MAARAGSREAQRLRAALTGLAGRHGLPPASVSRFTVLLERLALEAAPTTVHDPLQGVQIHVADALSALAVPELASARRIADLGSGAGVPGLVLAAVLPDAEVFLVESTQRKCAFIAATAEAMALTGAHVVCERAEAWTDGLATCDVVTARALAPLAVLCEYAAPLLRVDGVLVAWKGELDATELEDGTAAAGILGLSPPAVRAVAPYPGSRSRSLVVVRKVGATPAGYPRRPGIAAKRPLGVRRPAR